MSELGGILELFGFLNIEDVTLDSLKRSFKTRILEVHPDKGGDADLFDTLLRSYVYLTETIQRISGGRATLQNILSPDDLKRSDEIVNRFFEEFTNDEFNQQFEKQKKETHGYASWLATDTPEISKTVEAVEAVEAVETDLNDIFEKIFKNTKNTSIILHPEAMAYVSGSNIGTSLIENENSYTSELFTNPNYTDLYSAYTNDNIVYDKLSFHDNTKTFDEIISERNAPIAPLNDDERKAIYEFETKKQIKPLDEPKGFIIF